MSFRALVLEKDADGVSADIRDLDDADLPAGEVTVEVAYSTLNYKDGMILNGIGGMVRAFPHVPGIDYVGKVTASEQPDYAPGDAVILTGWEVGEAHWGGYAQKARAKAGWLVPLPDGLTPKRAMALGTAGFTAMLCVLALEEHGLEPGAGEVLVTGAAGGVGSVAVAVLSALGHHVVAGTGRPETHDYLRGLGAADFIDRAELATESKRVMQSERWAGVVDTVGSRILANAIAATRSHASVAACGLAAGGDLPATVYPFILRGVNLLGVESIRTPFARRVRAWDRLARDLPMDKLDAMTETIPLGDLMDRSKRILAGQVRGRTVVDVSA